jgi:hypothetical protein
MHNSGDKARVEIDGKSILVTLSARLAPDEGKEIGGDGFHVTYEEGDKEGSGGRHRYSELKPA